MYVLKFGRYDITNFILIKMACLLQGCKNALYNKYPKLAFSKAISGYKLKNIDHPWVYNFCSLNIYL